MSALDDAVGDALSALSKSGIDDPDVDLLRKVVAGLGPSVHNADSRNVSCSDDDELARVRTGYLVKKLGMSDAEATMDSVQAVCQQMSGAGGHKHRGAFYYLLATHHGRESVYV